MNRILVIAVMLLGFMSVGGANNDKYRKFVESVRAEVYSMDLPAFNVREIPEKYRNESAVYKAIYEDFDARNKTSMGRNIGPSGNTRPGVDAVHLTRMLIYVNDKAAIEKYSEFEFGTDDKTEYTLGSEERRRAMGVRLIKPDGRIVDIDTSDFVEVEEGKKGEKKSRKLAIPGLEIGDDIDVFFYTETRVQNMHPDPLVFRMKMDAPILNYRIHCVIDDKLTTQYRTLNGAPYFDVSRDKKDNFVLDMEIADIMSKEPRLWYRRSEQSPMIKMYVFNNRTAVFTPKSARSDGLFGNLPATTIIADRWDTDDWWLEDGTSAANTILKNHVQDGNKIAGEVEKKVKSGEMSMQEGADYLYNLLCYMYMANRVYIDMHDFSAQFYCLLKSHNFPVEAGLSTMGRQEPLTEVVNLDNTVIFSTLGENCGRCYFPPEASVFSPSEIPPDAQGRLALMWRKPKDREKAPLDDKCIEIRATRPAANRMMTDINVAFEGTMLRLNRIASFRGYTKKGAFKLLSEEDVNEGYRKYLSRIGHEVNVKENKKEAADRVERYADGRRRQIDDFKEEIESFHDTPCTDFVDGKITNLGIDPADPSLTYELSYTMDNLVKHAGNNLLLSVGKLLDDQIKLLPSDRERDVDAYIGTPRAYVTRIHMDIPDGYTVSDDALSALEGMTVNPAGSFYVKTSRPDPEKILIEITKCYTKDKLTVDEWPEMLKVLDAASAWNSLSLLLEKK